MQMRFSKLLVAISCLVIIQFHAAVHDMLAQNDRRNLVSGTGGSLGMDAISRVNLINLIMRSTANLSVYDTGIKGAILYQNKIIPDLPINQARKISSSFLSDYELKKPLSGDRFNNAGEYRSPYSSSILRLEMDTEEMAKRSATWFQFKGIDAMKPTLLTGLSYDTNSNNQKTTAASDSIIQRSRLSFIFNYGERPGSSTIANLLYQPAYLMNIEGFGVNEFEQEIMFQLGRELHRSAMAINNETTITAAPLRELPGRTKTIISTTRLKGIYDISPFSLMFCELNHSIQKRSGTGIDESQSIISDNVLLRYQYFLTPKISVSSRSTGGVQRIGSQNTTEESLLLGFNYAPSERFIFSLNGGYQFRQPPGEDTRISEAYDFKVLYFTGPKTVMSLAASKDIRPSFARNGIFLSENSFTFVIAQSIGSRWRATCTVDYYLREEDSDVSSFGLKQNDLGRQLDLEYLLDINNSMIFSFADFKVTDLRSESISKRLNFSVRWNHAF